MSDFLEGLRAQAAGSLFPTDGEVAIAGLAAPVTIRRDAWGVPAIEAASLDDLWFAQGLVTAGERLAQLDLALRAANGRLSEIFGEQTYESDRFVRTLGLHVAGRRYVEDWTDQDHAMHARFREGVRAWIAAAPAPPIEYQLLDLRPELPDDVEAWASCFAYLAWGLSNNHDKEFLRAAIARVAGTDAAATLVPTTAGGTGRGSNDWVVAGSLTASGQPLLANDPHLLALHPGTWLEVHLDAPGYTARGVALPFAPGVILGATPHHAWGATNVTGDVQDLVVLGSDTVTRVREEAIVVRGEAAPRLVRVEETDDGPVLTHVEVGMIRPEHVEIGERVALRWTGHRWGIRPSLALEAATATSFDAFRQAVLQVGCPGQNFVYADVDGSIGLQVTGVHPIRAAGDGTVPVPAGDDHAWVGTVSFEDLPCVIDPPTGFIATANDGLHADACADLLSMDFHEPYRARRIADLLRAQDDHDVASMTAIQTDTLSLPAAELVPLLGRLEPADDAQRDALAALAAWDGRVDAGSHEAALFHVWTDAIARRALGARLGEDLTRAYLAWRETWRCRVLPELLDDPDGWFDDDDLRATLDEAIAATDGKTWGDLHRLVLAHPLAAIPGLDALFTAAELPFDGDEQTVMNGGPDGTQGFRAAVIPSWRVVWDLADLDRSVAVLPGGISGNPASPHWNDQTLLYAQGRTRPAPMSADAIRASAVATLSVRPV